MFYNLSKENWIKGKAKSIIDYFYSASAFLLIAVIYRIFFEKTNIFIGIILSLFIGIILYMIIIFTIKYINNRIMSLILKISYFDNLLKFKYEKFDADVVYILTEIDNSKIEISQCFKEINYMNFQEILHTDYWTEEIIAYFYKLLEKGRADTIKEAINLYVAEQQFQEQKEIQYRLQESIKNMNNNITENLHNINRNIRYGNIINTVNMFTNLSINSKLGDIRHKLLFD